jgi:hypothetical protein
VIRYCLAIEAEDPRMPADFRRAMESLEAPDAEAGRPEVVYLWADHSMTTLPLHGVGPVYAPDSDEWHKVCAEMLGARELPPE